LAEAKQHIAQSISIFTTTDIPYEVAKSHYEMGLLLIKTRDRQSADSNLRQAERFFEEVSAKPDLELVEAAIEASAGGEVLAPPVRVSANNDVLLMQRLIEASASRELLLQELAAVVYENFPMSLVVVAKVDELGSLVPVVSQGISLTDSEGLCEKIELSDHPSPERSAGCSVVRLGNGASHGIALCFRSETGFETGRLQPLLRQAELGLETCSLRVSARHSPRPDFEHRVQTIIPGFICCSALMFDVVERIHKIRTSDVTVLITGESGTGKELIARAIHAESARARAIFLPFNCTATPKEIIDSQLFGHRRGSFTGATANYPGIIKAADGGTLFLDEIGDLSLEVQPKLMRFLQESEIQPLGETKPLRVDVRVLAATNTDLERAVEEGRFREDLFHRLNIIRIHVPPLRDRREEVPVLASHFLEHFAGRARKQGITFTSEAINALGQYDWPGNVRQLRNEIERVVAYSTEGSEVKLDDLSPEVTHRRGSSSGIRSAPSRGYASYSGGNGRSDGEVRSSYGNLKPPQAQERHMRLKEATAILERQLIEEALVRNRNNLSRTAIDLGLSRRGLRLKLGQLGIQRDDRA
jgi:DNA-binding NtrC family response regulator